MNQQELTNSIVAAIDALTQKSQEAPRKSRISKTVSRLIPTAQFENVTISTTMEIEVEWQTPEELLKKSEKFNSLVLEDYKKTESRVMAELNLAEKKAFPNEQLKNRLAGAAVSSEGFDSLD